MAIDKMRVASHDGRMTSTHLGIVRRYVDFRRTSSALCR